MNDPASPEPTEEHAPSTVTCTFGTYTQTGPWTEVRTLPWRELATLLTSHKLGLKEGPCVVPATFTGTQRAKADARQIDVVFLDSDAGATLDEIRAAIVENGWSAVISSTHSHLNSTTRVSRESWNKFCTAHDGEEDLPQRYLVEEKGFTALLAAGATVARETDELTFLAHQPCPKFRVALPLLRPWVAASYDDQDQANAAWKERIEALAGVLGLSHDQSCTDTSRAFFLPRRQADGPAPETAILEGELCDIFALPRIEPPPASDRVPAAGRACQNSGALVFTDPATGEIVNLRHWASGHAPRFQIAAALLARRPGVFNPRSGEGPKRHLRCVNEAAHTQAGADAATFVINASDSTNDGGFAHHCRHAHCDGQDRLFFLKLILEKGWLHVADLTNPEYLFRPVIRCVGGDLSNIVDQAENALLAAGLQIYQRGGLIVRPGTVPVSVSGGEQVKAHRIQELGDHALVEAFTIAATWEKHDGRKRDWNRVDAPLNVAVTYKQRAGKWRLPHLTGVISAPTLREDGSVLAIEGYDPRTGLLLDLLGTTFPRVPDHSSKEKAQAALALLDRLLDGFAFGTQADRSVALSAMLSACVRRSLPTVPLHAFTAPVAGSGKSKLVDLVAVLANGRTAAVITQGKTEEELEKRLGALLLAGDSMIAIDNCEASLGGDFLCQMLTQPSVRTRILGRSEAPEVPANAMVTATGNNLVLVGDMARRSLLCRLDPKCERPELRVFSHDPVATVLADRGRYLVAALTVLRAFHVAGRPKQRSPLGSFAGWSLWVRDALIWLGRADPVETLDHVREHDPKLDAIVAVLTQWWEVVGSERKAVHDIIDSATRTKASVGTSSKPEMMHPMFREALLTVAGEGGAINSRRLGRWLASVEDRIVGGMRIVRRGLVAGTLTWQLQQVESTRKQAA